MNYSVYAGDPTSNPDVASNTVDASFPVTMTVLKDTAASVPEPATVILTAMGLAGAAWLRRPVR